MEWIFHTIPKPRQYGYETWPKDAYKTAGGANNWAGMALDEQRGIVYVPTGSAAFDWYGGDRLGDNLFANSLLALDAETGERMWHFQMVRHDLWDRDLPAPPNLFEIEHNGDMVPAVAQITKSGHVFIFNRLTGAPLFPIGRKGISQYYFGRRYSFQNPDPSIKAGSFLPPNSYREEIYTPRISHPMLTILLIKRRILVLPPYAKNWRPLHPRVNLFL